MSEASSKNPELLELSLLELSARLQQREVTSVEATEASLARIEQVDARVRAFLHVATASAREQARASDERRQAGKSLGPLDGVPVGLKDVFLTEGIPTTAGSRVLEGYLPPYDGTVVERLKAAGAVLLGKLNQDEFAMGSSNENSGYFPTHNPWDLQRSPGGSSGGSAAAVAAREVFGAFGTDTGGSLRQPGSFTNTVGLKPTYGRVSRYGVVSYASSLDQVGPLTRTVADAAALLQAVAGPDPRDATSARVPVPDFSAALEQGVRGLKLGLPREYFLPGMDAEVEAAVRGAARELEAAGATVVDISLPHTEHALATYYLLATAEASSNLARYDGIRYGPRVDEGKGLRALYEQTRSRGFGAEVKRRIMLGTYALSAGYYDAYYLKAQKVRTLIRQDFTRAFEQVDAILSPASPTPPFLLGEKSQDPLAMYLLDVFTLPCNLAGIPGVSVPCGFTKTHPSVPLPIGLQILGKPFDEAGVLRIARAWERAQDFSHHRPPL